ncbi:MAG: 1-acyl-sn-glycerol-3-phosphate acyltransferase [Bacteroidales bacterium]|nr:1-acyl-sn-glycerol-3-phosphate acyltransferase [Candidatus Colimorpha onthohippi]
MDVVPYKDEEVPAAMMRLAQSESLPIWSSFVYPGRDIEDIKRQLLNINTIFQLQQEVMPVVFSRLVETTMTDFQFELSPNLQNDKSYLYVSNHRDIVMDAMLLENVLNNNGFPTSQIAVGTNLLEVPLMADAGRLNKMFGVARGGSPKEFYRCLSELSSYIRTTITQQGESVWIAQRNGRTKDGVDKTDPAIIKMFAMSSPLPLHEALSSLRIVPVSVTYEWEPCAVAKAIELAKSRNGKYLKAPGEDVRSVIDGLTSPKGAVRIVVGNPLTDSDLLPCEDAKQVAEMLDCKINAGKVPCPSHYLAYDMLHDTNRYQDCYDDTHRRYLLNQLEILRAEAQKQSVGQPSDFIDCAEHIFLGIYANAIGDQHGNL